MQNHKIWILATALTGALLLGGCGSADDPADAESNETTDAASTTESSEASDAADTTESEANQSPETAMEVAEALSDEIDSVSDVTEITEDNDPNDLIGRPNGYTAAAVLADEGGESSQNLGISSGATVEQWDGESGAQDRSDYIQEIQQEGGGILGSEWNYVHDEFLLRVDGNLKPSVADEYEAAFEELF